MCLFLTSPLYSGWFSGFQEPPVSLSMHIGDGTVNITNTSDSIIHEVVASTPDGKDKITLADTIEPHKTIIFKYQKDYGINETAFSMFLSEFNVTCKDYGTKKIKLTLQ